MSYPLKTRITFAASLLVVSLMLLSSWLILTYFEDKFRQASLAHLADALAVTAKDFQEKLNHSQQVLESIATEIPDAFFDNKEQMQSFLERQSTGRLTFDNGVILFSPEGRLEAVAPFQSDVMGMDFSFRAYYRVTADTLQPYISDPFRSRQAHNHPIIMLTEPIIDEHNNLRAILGGSIDLFGNNFLRHLLTGSIGEEGYFVLLDQTSTLIMHPEKDLILKGGRMILPAHIFDDLLSRSRGHVNKVDVAGEEMLTVFQHLTPIDWTLVALYPTREVYGPIREARIYFLGVLVVLTLLAVFVVRIMTDRLTAPLTRLTDKVRQLNEPDADFSLPAAGQFRELGDLAESIQTLMVDVSEKRRSMNDQILFLQNLMETIPSPVFYKSADFRYLGCNNMFEDIFGLPREEILGRKVTELMPDDWAELHNERDAELWEQGGQTS
ncbi:MAG: PAS domain-containing protein, partial [Desulfuromonadales bacterium]|nr:PAS domain-containing protein [Desulfuromonadales bacterium]